MKVQYIHDHVYKLKGYSQSLDKSNRRTFCFVLPEYELIETELVRLVTDNGYIAGFSMDVGVAKCHPEDPYIKTVGRDIAASSIKPIEFTIESMVNKSKNRNEIILELVSDTINLKVMVKKDYRLVRVLAVHEE